MSVHTQQGFTLIELLIVIAIIGILAAVLIPNLLAARNRANDSSAYIFLRNCISAMEMQRDQLGYITKATKCDDPLLGTAAQNLPTSVVETIIIPDSNSVDYTISVTSKTGKIFKYENGKLVQGN